MYIYNLYQVNPVLLVLPYPYPNPNPRVNPERRRG